MAIESNSDEVVPTYNEAYYEGLASEEEIYLEEAEEELRSKLISDTRRTIVLLRRHTAFESVSRGTGKSISGMKITADDSASTLEHFGDWSEGYTGLDSGSLREF